MSFKNTCFSRVRHKIDSTFKALKYNPGIAQLAERETVDGCNPISRSLVRLRLPGFVLGAVLPVQSPSASLCFVPCHHGDDTLVSQVNVFMWYHPIASALCCRAGRSIILLRNVPVVHGAFVKSTCSIVFEIFPQVCLFVLSGVFSVLGENILSECQDGKNYSNENCRYLRVHHFGKRRSSMDQVETQWNSGESTNGWA